MSFKVREQGNEVEAFLNSISLAELEKEALQRQGWGTSLMEDIMAVLREKAARWQ